MHQMHQMHRYSKQAGALAFHDTCRQTHIVLAEDISSHGHKRYHVVRRADIGGYHGPFNELIRMDSKCRLYFDLDSTMPTESTVQELIAEVCTEIFNVYAFQADPAQAIVLCSSNDTKFSKHVIFPQLVFRDNWTHMRQFVRAHISHPLVDFSVYSRNRCFRMLGCHKFGQFQRRFNYENGGLYEIEPTLVQVLQCPNPLECNTKIDYRVTGNGNVSLSLSLSVT